MECLTNLPTQSPSLPLIHEFFDNFPLPSILPDISTLFRKAASQKAWRPANPYNAVHICRQLQQLSKAAYILNGSDGEELCESTRVNHGINGPDLVKYFQYTGSGGQHTPFNNFPRWLDEAEYRQPIKALRRYCRQRSKKEWKHFYQYLAQCALSSMSFTEFEKPGKLFSAHSHVCKLVEACHLIHIRLGLIGFAKMGKAV